MSKQKIKPVVSELVEVILNTPVYIQFHSGLSLPYSVTDEENEQSVKISDDNSTIVLFNMITKQNDTVPIEDISGFRHYKNDDGSYDIDEIDSLVARDLEEIAACEQDELIDLTTAEIIARRCVYVQTEGQWGLQKHFKLKYTIEQLKKPSEQMMTEIREGYMNLIRSHREKSFVELDQLEDETKSSGGTAEDLEDIDTIKQMFRDIPQDVDLDSYKTIKDLYDFWPSLLLPKPSDILTLDQIEALSPDSDKEESELIDVLAEVNDVNKLRQFLPVIGNQDYVDEEILRAIKYRILGLQGLQHFTPLDK